ncbi:hypothetical protein TSMEX_005321 [Taenia solium]|eukprot:TsM_000884600 transcript=TsM_000884600 gene=TsM_000884600
MFVTESFGSMLAPPRENFDFVKGSWSYFILIYKLILAICPLCQLVLDPDRVVRFIVHHLQQCSL